MQHVRVHVFFFFLKKFFSSCFSLLNLNSLWMNISWCCTSATSFSQDFKAKSVLLASFSGEAFDRKYPAYIGSCKNFYCCGSTGIFLIAALGSSRQGLLIVRLIILCLYFFLFAVYHVGFSPFIFNNPATLLLFSYCPFTLYYRVTN